MKLTIIFLFALLTIVVAMPTPSDEVTLTDEEWEDYKKTHNKTYSGAEEEEQRKKNYLITKQKVKDHNVKFDAGEVSYSLGINQFADRTPEELSHGCIKRPDEIKN